MSPSLTRRTLAMSLASSILLAAGLAPADTLELADGTVLKDCYVRDDAIRYLVWEKMAHVGRPPRIIPRSQVKQWKLQRDAAWDAHPDLPDLSVTFIELTPKLAGLHGCVQYDKFGRPSLRGPKGLVDLGERTVMEPEKAVAKLKLKHEPGEEITLTAHVKNVGFAAAKPFRFVWRIDKKDVQNGRCQESLKEMAEATFVLKWKWQEGFHHATFRIVTDQPEIATINNEVTDPLWGWGFEFVVTHGRIKAWHEGRTACGTFCFEDYYRWHVEMMNTLFEASKYPSAPDGIRARVRLDRVTYTDDINKTVATSNDANGIYPYQGRWTWLNDEDKNHKWVPPHRIQRNSTEWSLPHELGHQLGIADWYQLDCNKYWNKNFRDPDTGEILGHSFSHAMTMMHSHGPHLWSEADAGYLNMSWDKPRGHFGDYYFAIPRQCFLRIVDVNGRPVEGAKVEVFQRGCEVDPKGKAVEDRGVTYWPVIEDGNFTKPLSKHAVIAGASGADGLLRLPNRPVKEVRTLNGFHRKPNPFGNMDVVGPRDQMLVRVTKYGRPCYYFLETYSFNVAWFRGQKDRHVERLKTPYRSVDSPPPPRGVRIDRAGRGQVKLSWQQPACREQHYLDRPMAYRLWRRPTGPEGLSVRPWFPVATVEPGTHQCTIDLKKHCPRDSDHRTERFAVSTVGQLGVESELVEILLKPKK